MSFFKKIEKKLRDVKDKIVDDIIPNELKSGAKAKESIEYVREKKLPVFHLVETDRLNSHSKGDDFRNFEEIKSTVIWSLRRIVSATPNMTVATKK